MQSHTWSVFNKIDCSFLIGTRNYDGDFATPKMELTIFFLAQFFFSFVSLYSQSPQKVTFAVSLAPLVFRSNTDQIAVDLCFPFFAAIKIVWKFYVFAAWNWFVGADIWLILFSFAFHPTRWLLFSFLFGSPDNSNALTFTHSLSVWLWFGDILFCTSFDTMNQWAALKISKPLLCYSPFCSQLNFAFCCTSVYVSVMLSSVVSVFECSVLNWNVWICSVSITSLTYNSNVNGLLMFNGKQYLTIEQYLT